MNITEYVGKRVLVSIGDNDAIQQSAVQQISPNKKHVLLLGDHPNDTLQGWFRVADIVLHEVL